MRGSLSSAVLFCLLSVSVTAREVAPPEFRLPLMREAPVVDGVVGAEEWADAHGSFGFVRYPTDTVGPIKGSFKIGRTADRLYFAGIGEIGPGGLLATVKPRRGNVACERDDTYEFVFVPDRTARRPDIRHIIINYNGAYRTQANLGGNMAAWIPETLLVKSSTRDGRWYFEFSVSLDEIGFSKAPADRHSIRICRNFKNNINQWGYQSSVRPNEGGFFAAGKTIPFVFDDAAPSVQLEETASRGDARWRAELLLTNPTGKALTLEAKVEGRPVNSQPGVLLKTVTLKSGESVRLPVEGPILGDERVDLTTDVRYGGKRVFFRQVGWRPQGPAPEWLEPGETGGAVKFDFAYYPSYDRMRLRADLSSLAKRPGEVKVELKRRSGRLLAETRLTLGTDGVADELWDVPDLKAETTASGDMNYTLTLTAPGVEKGVIVREFVRGVFAWEGYKGGTSDAIPVPFTPVEEYRDGLFGLFGRKHVKTILRDHTVGAYGLWAQVNAAGKDILAGPVTLAAEGEDVELDATTDWDVDGMMRWTLTVDGTRCDSLKLTIPVKAAFAKLLHACADGMRFNYAGAVPPGQGRVWDSSKAPRTSIIGDYLPYVWVGGPLRGIAVFGESDKGWVTDPANSRCQEIFRDADGTVRLVLNLVQKPVTLDGPRTIKMAFQATPVKPMEKNWRSSDIGNLVGACYYWGGYSASDDIHPYDGTDLYFRKMGEARRTGKVDRDYVRRAIAERVAYCPTNSPRYAEVKRCITAHYNAGHNVAAASFRHPERKLVFYTNGRGVRLGTDVGRTFCDEWTVEPFTARPLAFGATKSYSLDPNRAYLDFAAYWWEKMLSSGACDYLYWDDIFCQSNHDLVGTESYRTADGDIQPAGGIFNQRAQVRRCAVLQTELGKTSHKNWVHMTNTALAPVLAFAGMNYDWEDVAGDTALQERYSRECIQAATIGRQFGNQVAVMGYFATKDPKSAKLKWLERTGTGACLTHELQWPRVKVWREAHARLVDWGYRKNDTTVWNYWDEDTAFPADITGGTSAALAMARAGEGAVVVVSDWDRGGTYTVRPDLQALGLSAGVKAYDLETGKELPVADGAVTVKLARLDYTMIRFE